MSVYKRNNIRVSSFTSSGCFNADFEKLFICSTKCLVTPNISDRKIGSEWHSLDNMCFKIRNVQELFYFVLIVPQIIFTYYCNNRQSVSKRSDRVEVNCPCTVSHSHLQYQSNYQQALKNAPIHRRAALTKRWGILWVFVITCRSKLSFCVVLCLVMLKPAVLATPYIFEVLIIV